MRGAMRNEFARRSVFVAVLLVAGQHHTLAAAVPVSASPMTQGGERPAPAERARKPQEPDEPRNPGAGDAASATTVAEAKRLLEAAEEVARQVEEVRGWKFKEPVEKDVRTEAQLKEFLEKKVLEEEYGGGKLERVEAMLKTIGLFPRDQSLQQQMLDLLLSQVAGFYDPQAKAFYMLAGSTRYGDAGNRLIMAHELTHALDDQYVDLRALMEPKDRKLTEDESFAIAGVVEGSATASMFAWMTARMQAGEFALGDIAKMVQADAERMQPFVDAPPYLTLLAANYLVGLHFITKGKGAAALAGGGRRAGGAAPESGGAIRDAAKDPPQSTEQLLHPDKYWGERDAPVRVANDDEVAALVAERFGAPVQHRDTLGELVIALFGRRPSRGDPAVQVAAMSNPRFWTNRAATGWGGDRLYLVAHEVEANAGANGGAKAGATAGAAPRNAGGSGVRKRLVEPRVVWLTAWDTEEDRAEFTALVRERDAAGGAPWIVERGRAAAFLFGAGSTAAAGDAEEQDAKRAASLRQALTAVLDAARFAKDGEPWHPRD